MEFRASPIKSKSLPNFGVSIARFLFFSHDSNTPPFH